ncbi:hypothetical protein CHS0354_042940 [Potamilus streckersoni]|uniref:Uncharacterized protein n=1 Tax=Potamilus streckersoni TaxID=2493646 RepID=A0AAE0W8B0_9BIVA|nr:hypothetical protein CHS0354_042940 [Potamilus streckersoni]
MGNSTSTRLTQITKCNRKCKFGRLGKIFQCFKGEDDTDQNQRKGNAIDFEEPFSEQRKNGPIIPFILPGDKAQVTDSYNVFHEKLCVNLSVNEIESGDNVSTRATPGLSSNDSFACLSSPIDTQSKFQLSPSAQDFQSPRDTNGPSLDTRDRRFRPKAAKGNRTRSVSNNVDIYLPGAVFAIMAEDQSEGSNIKKMQDQCLCEWMRRCQEAENKKEKHLETQKRSLVFQSEQEGKTNSGISKLEPHGRPIYKKMLQWMHKMFPRAI